MFNVFEFNVFYQFIDKRIEFVFIHNDILYTIIIISNYEVCLTFNTITLKNVSKLLPIKIGRFDVIMLYYYMFYIYYKYFFTKNIFDYNYYCYNLDMIWKKRMHYFNTTSKHLLDNTKYANF